MELVRSLVASQPFRHVLLEVFEPLVVVRCGCSVVLSCVSLETILHGGGTSPTVQARFPIEVGTDQLAE